jgi:Rrf2 family transcriptional regulator, cysteine metabolism repressor
VKLSTRGEYGLRTMAGLDSAYAAGPVSLAQIARDENISLAYLEQLIAVLRKKGLVASTRGAHGGYKLAMAPDKITVGDVVRALEGPIAPVDCASEVDAKCHCDRQPGCPTRAVWERLRDSIADTLDATTLADIVAAR